MMQYNNNWKSNNSLPYSTEFVVRPSCAVIRLIQDKYLQKLQFQSTTQIPIHPSSNAVLQQGHVDAVHEALHQLGVTPDLVSSSNDLMLYAEGWIDLDYEIAVMVVRSSSSTKCYPAVTAIHQNSICRVVLAPARYISPAIQDMAQQYAMDAIDSLPGSVGVGWCVWCRNVFDTKTAQVLWHEIAPRPHKYRK
jgi:phosphoribosylaminoimidazole carboxylase (NCAIR synthetase)